MVARRNRYKSDFKAQVALEALTGEKTTQELAQIYKIHPAMITAWKRQLINCRYNQDFDHAVEYVVIGMKGSFSGDI